jgi:5-amino-6-(5-phosphoribosylamino)uracil reductase
VTERPYVLLSVAASVDGYIDDASDRRLVLSDAADLDRVDELRAGCDAILVGAGTIRRDNPRLLVRSQARREARLAHGLTASPVKVTMTRTGDLDPAASFFTAGDPVGDPAGDPVGDAARLANTPADAAGAAPAARARLVYTRADAAEVARSRLADAATVIDAGPQVTVPAVLADLARRGIRRLLVEGGTSMNTQFLAAGAADELQLAIAPFFVGDLAAPRFVSAGAFPHDPAHPMELAEARAAGSVMLLRYLLDAATYAPLRR